MPYPFSSTLTSSQIPITKSFKPERILYTHNSNHVFAIGDLRNRTTGKIESNQNACRWPSKTGKGYPNHVGNPQWFPLKQFAWSRITFTDDGFETFEFAWRPPRESVAITPSPDPLHNFQGATNDFGKPVKVLFDDGDFIVVENAKGSVGCRWKIYGAKSGSGTGYPVARQRPQWMNIPDCQKTSKFDDKGKLVELVLKFRFVQ